MNYQIGPWQFISNRCVITSNHLERELDPLLVKLLLHFIDKPQQIVSAKSLLRVCGNRALLMIMRLTVQSQS
ncbi:MAG: DNA-binding response OmpR family regulator [Gammaproteobacteria bacterium]|jgi:DNA-binding response OmpR family regulator